MTRRTLLLATLLCSFQAEALAQSKKDFSTVRFYPAVGPGNYVTLEGAPVGGHLNMSYGAFFDFSTDTLTVEEECSHIASVSPLCTDKDVSFVRLTGLAHLTASMSLFDRAQISLDVPLGFTDADRFDTVAAAGNSINIKPHEGFSFADARLSAKVRVFGAPDDVVQLAASAFTTLPTAMITSNGDCRDFEQCAFLGERGVQAGANFIAEFVQPDFRVAANVGVAYRPKRNFLDAEVGTELRYGVAGQYHITPLVHVGAEVVGTTSVLGLDDYPLEARGMFTFGDRYQITLGGGAGILGDIGSPTYRVFLGGHYSNVRRDEDQDGIEDERDACPTDPEDKDGFMDDDGCPDPDNDNDGILDRQDRCPLEPEDVDGFEDEDGCPDPDNDGDGVPDGYDACEGEKEDYDGDRDDDGCPDYDSDRDGINDDVDQCPNEPEDTDGLADDDGCPEEDFDGDGLKDVEDACPDAPESWNGILDEDGCPEDDADGDTIPDAIDRCPDNPETFNGTNDGDGCPDGAMVIVPKGQLLLPTAVPVFERNVLKGAAGLLRTVADYVTRNHQRGSVRVVVVAPEGDPDAAARASRLADLLQKRLPDRQIKSGHVVGTPLHIEFELVPPGLTELPRAAPAKRVILKSETSAEEAPPPAAP